MSVSLPAGLVSAVFFRCFCCFFRFFPLLVFFCFLFLSTPEIGMLIHCVFSGFNIAVSNHLGPAPERPGEHPVEGRDFKLIAGKVTEKEKTSSLGIEAGASLPVSPLFVFFFEDEDIAARRGQNLDCLGLVGGLILMEEA